jgi:antitoxin component YwqK of YwqJK toxin-antitoxin module
MRTSIFVLLLSFIGILSFAQQKTDTVFNQKDKFGKKQGFWKMKYENGALKYTTFFKNDKPVGEVRRYYDDNSLKSIMRFDATGKKAYAKLYYQMGPIAAEGNYINSQKDSLWKYYSFYSKKLVRTEFYTLGKLNGKSLAYSESGKVSEEVTYKDNIKEGPWKQYYEDGTVKMFSGFTAGKRSGAFILNYPNGIPEWNGKYVDDKMDGKWVHFNEKGIPETTIEYKDGKAPNASELEEKQSQLLKDLEKKKGQIPEPNIDDVMGSGNRSGY